MKKNGALVLNPLLFLFGMVGIWHTVFGEGFMNGGAFLYYTVQSNLLAMTVSVIVFVFECRRLYGHKIPAGVQFLRLFGTIAITLTFIVFSLMLTPQLIAQGDGAYLTSLGNLCVHNMVPICAILDWCLYGSAKKLRKGSAYSGMIPALLYIGFVFACIKRGITFSGNIVPYFFLDFEQYGWLSIGNGGIGVIYWIVILAAVLAVIGQALLRVVRRREETGEEI